MEVTRSAPNTLWARHARASERTAKRVSVAGVVAALVMGLMIPIGVAAPAQAAGKATCSSFGWSYGRIIGSCSNKKFQVMYQCWPSKQWHYKSLGGPTGLSFNFDACGVSWVTDAQAII